MCWGAIIFLEAVISKLIVVMACLWAGTGSGFAQEIFSDGFESGGRLNWSNLVATCAIPPEADLEDVSSPTTVVGSGTPGSCTSAAFVNAVAQGGIITFDCRRSTAIATHGVADKGFPISVSRQPLPHRGQIFLSQFTDGDELPLRLANVAATALAPAGLPQGATEVESGDGDQHRV